MKKAANILNILVTLFVLIISIVRAGESLDFNKLAEEKARIKADDNNLPTPVKPTSGQLIFSNHPKPTAHEIDKHEVKPVSTPTPVAQQPRKSRKSESKKQSKPEHHDSSDDGKKSKNEEKETEEVSSSSDKKNNKNNKGNKKSSGSDSSDNSKDSEELPKRLFRPRFRAESSAESIKISLIITISLSLVGILFI